MEKEIKHLSKQVELLQIQVSELQEELCAQNKQKTTILSPLTKVFLPGDRIRVLNRVKKPPMWDEDTQGRLWHPPDAKKGTVNSSTLTRVYFTTDNGVSTWRNVKNVTHCHE
jgi:predicted P-loop ATPase/GTPase